MSKDLGEISKTELVTFEALLKIARKYNVSSFGIAGVTVNLGERFDALPEPESNPGAAMDEDLDDGMESAVGDSLLHSPLLG
jgi:hypothetical protein